jgi:hypothetical protein
MAMTSRRRLHWTAGATILTVAMAAAVALPGTADAQPCNLNAPQGSCTTQGFAFLNSGTLTMVAPPMLNWFGQVTGTTQTLYDSFFPDTSLEVLDLRGLSLGDPSSGWNITATATPFTGPDSATIPDTGSGSVLAIGGGWSTETATNVPSSVCATPSTCTPATTTLDYPIFIPTTADSSIASPPPVMIYNAEPGTGTGTVQIGSFPVPAANPAVWSVTLPGDVTAEPYISTITTTVAAGP